VTEEIFARLTLHELLLEVVMANQLVMFDKQFPRTRKPSCSRWPRGPTVA